MTIKDPTREYNNVPTHGKPNPTTSKYLYAWNSTQKSSTRFSRYRSTALGYGNSVETGVVVPVPRGLCQSLAATVMFHKYYSLIYFIMLTLLVTMTVYDFASDPLIRVDPTWFIAMNIAMVVLLGIEVLCRLFAYGFWEWTMSGFGMIDMMVLCLVNLTLALYWVAPNAEVVTGDHDMSGYAFLAAKNCVNLLCMIYLLKRSLQQRSVYRRITLGMSSVDLTLKGGTMCSGHAGENRPRNSTYNTFLSAKESSGDQKAPAQFIIMEDTLTNKESVKDEPPPIT